MPRRRWSTWATAARQALNSGGAGGFANIENVKGDNANDTLRGTAGPDVFTVSTENDGTAGTAVFEDFSILEGVGGNDTFTFNASLTGSASGGDDEDVFTVNVDVAGTIDGGGQANNPPGDMLDVSGHATAQVVNLGDSSATALNSGGTAAANIEKFKGDNANDTLRGTAGPDVFTVSTENDGTAGTAVFEDFSILEGVGGNDTFTFNASLTGSASGGDDEDVFTVNVDVAGTIDGGGQANNPPGDMLDVSGHATAQVVNLGDSSTTALNSGGQGGFANIEKFKGDNANDTLHGMAGPDVFTVSTENDGTAGPRCCRRLQYFGRCRRQRHVYVQREPHRQHIPAVTTKICSP